MPRRCARVRRPAAQRLFIANMRVNFHTGLAVTPYFLASLLDVIQSIVTHFNGLSNFLYLCLCVKNQLPI